MQVGWEADHPARARLQAQNKPRPWLSGLAIRLQTKFPKLFFTSKDDEEELLISL